MTRPIISRRASRTGFEPGPSRDRDSHDEGKTAWRDPFHIEVQGYEGTRAACARKAGSRRNPAQRRFRAPSVMSQMIDFVFDFELLPLKFGDPDVIRMRSGLFFGYQFIEVGMLGFECFDMFHCGHASTSFPGSEADNICNANAGPRRL
jgi:hypothetical protein